MKNKDPRATLKKLIDERYPVYAEADIIVDSKNEGPDGTVRFIADALDERGEGAGREARR